MEQELLVSRTWACRSDGEVSVAQELGSKHNRLLKTEVVSYVFLCFSFFSNVLLFTTAEEIRQLEISHLLAPAFPE